MVPVRKQVARRVCLRCNQKFLSRGPGNRICPDCTRINNRLDVPESILALQRGVKRHNGEVIEGCDDAITYAEGVNHATA